MRRAVMQGTFGILVAVAAGCSARTYDLRGDAMEASLPFDGAWSVAWCSETEPRLDCGGFWITLVQNGSRVCGDFSGALVNLRQIDEGSVTGIAAGDAAMLEVKSSRSDAVLRIRATRVGQDIEWKQVGVIEEGGTDIDIIAVDEVLRPAAAAPGRSAPEACG